MVELKPCPFCGGNAILAHDHTGLGMSYIRCECCGIESVHFIKSFEVASDDLAIKYWNRRTDPTENGKDVMTDETCICQLCAEQT